MSSPVKGAITTYELKKQKVISRKRKVLNCKLFILPGQVHMSDSTCRGSPQGKPGQGSLFSSHGSVFVVASGGGGWNSLFREVHFQGKVCVCASLALSVEQPVRSWREGGLI